MKVHLAALGCRLNEAELQQWAEDFQARGHSISPTPENSDLVVLNTCAVTHEAARKSRNLIHRAHRTKPTARLVVSGCYASLEPEDAAAQLGVDLVVDNRDKDRLVDIASRELGIPSMPVAASEPGEAALYTRGRHRAFIKIQDGCRYRCTFCIVTVARGEERSRPAHEIISEINRLVSEGVREAVLTGVHVGGYGSDLKEDLASLIRRILEETDLPRLRLASVEPWDLPDEFFSLFENPRLMPHMHLPLQSGSDTVLRRMARRCKTQEFERLIATARTVVPDFNVTSDIIAGFPGETDAEWRETLEFVEKVDFGHLHIFSYSPREGTKAAGLPGPVTNDVKKARVKELHALAQRMKRETLQRYIGREMEILRERPTQAETDDKPALFAGYTPNYLRTLVPLNETSARDKLIHRVRLVQLSDDGEALLAEPV